MFEDIWQIASRENFGPVVFGGLLGGILQPVVARLSPRAANPPGANYWQSPLLGVAAAGITIYVVANSQRDEPVQLLFFAMLCGLAFPALLTSAVDGLGKRSEQATQEVLKAANATKSEDLAATVRGAQQLQAAMVQNPAQSVKEDDQAVIDTIAQQAVNNIAQTEVKSAQDQRQVVEVLKDVGNVALRTGWDEARKAVVDQLAILSSNLPDDSAKKSANEAAKRLSDPEVP